MDSLVNFDSSLKKKKKHIHTHACTQMRVTYSYEGLTFQIYLPPLRGQSLTMTEQFLFKSGEKRTSFEQEETFARSFHGLKATAFEKNG